MAIIDPPDSGMPRAAAEPRSENRHLLFVIREHVLSGYIEHLQGCTFTCKGNDLQQLRYIL